MDKLCDFSSLHNRLVYYNNKTTFVTNVTKFSKMKRFLLVIFMVVPLAAESQETQFRKVPKQISLETGYRRITGSEFSNQASNGFSLLLDYAWQLSGFSGGRASYISVPLGYTYMLADSDTSRSARVISYGWTVRHELRTQNGWVPYLGYALMLNNYAEAGIDGHRFAHQTRFSLGLNRYGSSDFQPYVQLDYSMTFYPEWGTKGSMGYKFVELKIGARFSKRKV